MPYKNKTFMNLFQAFCHYIFINCKFGFTARCEWDWFTD